MPTLRDNQGCVVFACDDPECTTRLMTNRAMFEYALKVAYREEWRSFKEGDGSWTRLCPHHQFERRIKEAKSATY